MQVASLLHQRCLLEKQRWGSYRMHMQALLHSSKLCKHRDKNNCAWHMCQCPLEVLLQQEYLIICGQYDALSMRVLAPRHATCPDSYI